MKKLLMLALLILIMLFLGILGSAEAQETRINNPWIKGRIKFQNGYYMWDSASSGVKINGSLYLQNELWINSFYLKDSASYIVFNKTPIFPTRTGWVYNDYIVSLDGSKIIDSTITYYKLHPDLLNLIFKDTINVKGLTTLYNQLKTRYDVLHGIDGSFKSTIFSGVIKYSINSLMLIDPGKIYLNIGSTMDTTGGILNVLRIDGSLIDARTITSNQLGDTSVSGAKIKINSIDSNKIVNGSVANNDLATNSVDVNKIQNNSISTAKIQDNSITSDKIVNSSVTEQKINRDAITERKIYNGAVTTSKIADRNITPEKLDTSRIKGAKIINDTLCVSTYVGWLSKLNTDGSFIERAPTLGEDQVGYSFPRSGKIKSITISDGSSYYTEDCNIYFNNSDFITIKIVNAGPTAAPHIHLAGIDIFTVSYAVTNGTATQFTLEIIIN